MSARRTSTALYHQMDRREWPETVPPLTDAEAIKAARLLWRRFYWRRSYEERRRPVPKKMPKLVIEINSRLSHAAFHGHRIEIPKGDNWHHLVHSLSHRFHGWLRPGDPGHGDNHRHLEREMIEHVVNSGWLDGKLKPKPRKPRPPKPAAPKPDPIVAEHDKAVARVKAWKTRLRRAKTGLANAQKAEQRLRRKRQKLIRFSLTD